MNIATDIPGGYLERWEEFARRGAKEHDFNWAFTAQGRQYMNLMPLQLDEAEKESLMAAAGGVSRLLEEILPLVLARKESLSLLGIPEEIHSLLEEPLPFLTTLGRFDWVLDRQGQWRLLEFNSETPSGFLESVFLQEFIVREEGAPNPNEGLGEGILEAVRRRLAADPGIRRIGLAGFLDHNEDRGNLKALAEILAPLDVEFHVGDVRALQSVEDTLVLAGSPVDGLFSYYSIDWYRQDPGGPALLRLLEKSKVILLNSAQSLVLHSKGLFAAAWLLRERLSRESQRVLDTHLPYTCLDPDPFWGKPCVIKSFHGREGKGTVIFEKLGKQDLTRLKREEPDFFGPLAFQEKIDIPTIEMPNCYNGRFSVEDGYPVLSTFHLAGRDMGFFARVGGPVTDGNALWYAVI